MKRTAVAICLFSLLFTACSQDSGQTIDCDDDELYDHVNEVCVARSDNNEDDASETDDDDADNQDPGDADEDDTGDTDTDTDTDTDEINCDEDGDGDLKFICGGNDCDDNDPLRASHFREICDHIDNNCDGVVNGGIDCTFYAHTRNGLYSIDPFALTAIKQSDLEDESGDSINILDIDTHPSGVLYGNTRYDLYVFYNAENYWIHVADLSNMGDANGLAIDNDGVAYITAENHFFAIDLADIEAEIDANGLTGGNFNFSYTPQKIDITGGEFYSSGDAVVNKQNTFYMTSKHDDNEDYLVEIERDTGAAVEIGPTGYPRIFGLTAGWQNLYGTTRNGELIIIDNLTGESELLHVFDGKEWFGAASTPLR